jgi:hypothetical protein
MDTEARQPRANRESATTLLVAAALALVWWLLRRDMPLNHDVAWFIVAAERMWDGGTYLDDFFEVNMPLAIAAYIPPLAVARALSISVPAASLAWTGMLVTMVITTTCRVAALTEPAGAMRLSTVVHASWSLLVLAILPAYDLSQREHLAAAFVLPFVVAMGAPAHALGTILRAGVSILAALGCYLKPQFAGLPLLLLATRAHRWGWRESLWSLETACLVAVGTIYALWVGIFYPDWFVVATWASDLYGHLQASDPLRFAQADSFVPSVAATALLAVATFVTKGRARRHLPAFVAAVLYAWIAFLLQGKGWRYQMLPATILSLAWIPLWIAAIQWRDVSAKARCVAALVLLLPAALVALHAVQVNREAPKLSNLARSSIGEALSVLQPGDSVIAISTTVIPFFPAVTHLRLRWASRYSALWPMAALGRSAIPSDAHPQASFQRYEAPFRRSVAMDLQRFQPDLALVDLRQGQFGIAPGFDMLAYLRAAPEFARQWEAYELLGQSRHYAIYARRIDVSSDDRASADR